MNKTILKLKIMQLIVLNKGKIEVIPAMDKKSYILDSNLYYGNIKLPKKIKMIYRHRDLYKEKISYELRDTINDEYICLINLSSKKELNKSSANVKNKINEFLEINYPNITLFQFSSLSYILDSKLDFELIKLPKDLTLKIVLYGPNDSVQCEILDINAKKIGVLNCYYKKDKKLQNKKVK